MTIKRISREQGLSLLGDGNVKLSSHNRISGYIIGFVSAVVIAATVMLFAGCASATKTAYRAESVGYITLKAVSDAYKAFVAAGGKLSDTDNAKFHTLFQEAKDADIAAVATTKLGVSADTANAQKALTDLATFATSIGLKL